MEADFNGHEDGEDDRQSETGPLITKVGAQNGRVSRPRPDSFEPRPHLDLPVGLLLPVVWNAQMCRIVSPSRMNGRR